MNKSELDLFLVPLSQTSIDQEQWVEYHPIANITDNGINEFYVSSSSEHNIDLAQTQLYIKANIYIGRWR